MSIFGTTRAAIDPVAIPLDPTGADRAAQRLRSAARRDGFAVFTVEDAHASGPQAMASTAALLGLGRAYVPAIYAREAQRFGYDSDGFNTISAAVTDSGHRYFGTGAAQGFHTDGTLEGIGVVASSLLWFERAAPEGGHTTIFRATEAFEVLRSTHPAAAASLMSNDALTRVATSFQPQQSTTGPAFADLEVGLRTRWADDGNEIWTFNGESGQLRELAVARMREYSRPGSPFRTDLEISSRTGLLLCNTRVAHGRTAFHAEPGERILLRGLYTSEVR
ncbi:TauD/TfdA family dioxygenase [Nocardia noduli]|uniref:TauD/TfdA family dioxygenase n=1 Tax=Nocardia noduli TaxID=2815722 RepID=UPI001C23380E|nr:TauD/TfdA family dioxygenase [Nocardia noduli]